jgi:hypothetical protein
MTRFLLALSVACVWVTGCAFDDEDDRILVRDDLGQWPDGPSTDANTACSICGPGTMCVQLLNGTCGSHAVECKPIVTGCEQATCSTACDNAYCDRQISTCSAAPCAADIPGAFHCYGV